MMYLQVVGGFAILLVAAELLVRGGVALAERFGVSPLVIGMTIVALGTSAPELVVSLDAGLSGAPGLAIGNIVGSNIANIWLILGITCLVTPLITRPDAMFRDALFVMGGSVVFVGLMFDGELGRVAGAILVVLFIAFLGGSYWRGTKDKGLAEETAEEVAEMEVKAFKDHPLFAVVAVVVGIAGLALGSDLLVEGGVEVARNFGVSEEVIGLTLFAFGTSLPELAASVVAAYRGHPDVALGNVVGSNIFNMLGVGGLVALVVPLPVAPQLVAFDVWVMLAATLMLLPFLFGKIKLTRPWAGLFFLLYIAYIGSQVYGVDKLMARATGVA